MARVESRAGEPAPPTPTTVPQRALLPGGQELWTAPPFTEGSIIEIETTVGLVYLVTVLAAPQPRRQEGGSMLAEAGSAFFVEEIDGV